MPFILPPWLRHARSPRPNDECFACSYPLREHVNGQCPEQESAEFEEGGES